MQSIQEFRLTEEQIMLKETIKKFVDAEVKPDCRRRELFADPADRIPWDWIEALSKMGLRTLVVPEELGGSGADMLTNCIAGEELSVGDLGLGVTFDQTWRFTPMLTDMATDEQRDRFLPTFMEDDKFLLATGLHEDDAGSDHFLPYNEPGHGARTTAVREKRNGKDGWVLNGRKTYISNGGTAKLYTIYARTDQTKGGVEGLSVFWLELGHPGFTIGRVEDKIGQRLVQNGELIFSDCWIPEENFLGERIALRSNLAGTRHRNNANASATALGPARAAFEDALAYAHNRIQGGRPIIQHQAMKMMLADMDIQIGAARSMIWHAAWMADYATYPEEYDLLAGARAKVFVSEIAFNVCRWAMEMFGGAGVMRDVPVEKYLRDATTFLHSDGTNQINRLRIGNYLEGQTKPF